MKKNTLQQEVYLELVSNILPFWATSACDENYGGYVGEMFSNGAINEVADKSVISHARILWSFSESYNSLNDIQYLQQATGAFEFLIEKFIDKQCEGVYYTLSYDAEIGNDSKNIVAQAYVIYSLAAYYKASGDKSALNYAHAIYTKIEIEAKGHELEGYICDFNRSWCKKSEEKYLYAQTHIHLIEAYSELLTCEENIQVHKSLTYLIQLFIHQFVNMDIMHVGQKFSLNGDLLSNTQLYGHDLESGWLLVSAARTLKDKVLIEQCTKISLSLINKIISENDKQSSSFSLGIQFGLNFSKQEDTKREGWVQAEAISAFSWAYATTGKSIYKKWLLGTWDYIVTYIKDREHGDWHSALNEDRTLVEKQLKIGPWKCPYHSVRACLKLYHLLDNHELSADINNNVMFSNVENNNKEAV